MSGVTFDVSLHWEHTTAAFQTEGVDMTQKTMLPEGNKWICQLTRRDFLSTAAMLMSGRRLSGQRSTSPFAILDLNHISIGVSDLARSLEFYQELFDLTVYTRQNSGQLPIMTIGSGPQFVALSQNRRSDSTQQGVGHHFCVHLENFDPDRVIRSLAELGVEARVFPWTYNGTRYDLRPAAAQRPLIVDAADTPEVVFNDPDGVLLQIQDVSYCGGVGRLGGQCGIPERAERTREAAFAVRTLNHVSIPVSNVRRSFDYYHRVFGFSHKTSQSRGAVPILTIGSGPQFIALRQGHLGGHHFCLGIDLFDPQQAIQTLSDHGVEGRLRLRRASDQRPAYPNGEDTPEVTFIDPDGITVQIQDTSYCGGVGPLGNVC